MCIRLDSNDINLLIYQYLKERGLNHTAFGFFSEAQVTDQPLKPGSLISYLHKSLQMEELYAHLHEKDFLSQGISNCTNKFSLLKPHDCRYFQPPSPLLQQENSTYTIHSASITCLAFLSDVISSSLDGTIRIWAEGGAPIILPHVTATSEFSPVLLFDAALNGKIASVSQDGLVRIWINNELSTSYPLFAVTKLLWNQEGSILLVVSDYKLYVFSGEQFELRSGIDGVVSVQWRNNEEFSVVSEKAVYMWAVTGKHRVILEETCSTARWNCEGTVLGIVSCNRLGLFNDKSEIWWISVRISEFDFAPGSNILVTGGHSGEIQFWDIEKRVILKSLQGHEGKIVKISHRSDGDFVATAGSDGVLHIWKSDECTKHKSISIENFTDL